MPKPVTCRTSPASGVPASREVLALGDAMGEVLRTIKAACLSARDGFVETTPGFCFGSQAEAVLEVWGRLRVNVSRCPESCLPVMTSLAGRVEVLRKFSLYLQETGQDTYLAHPGELWEQEDEAALVAWEGLRARMLGQVPLFDEVG